MVRHAVVLAMLLSLPAGAQQTGPMPAPAAAPGHVHQETPAPAARDSPAAGAFRQANQDMMRAMDVPLTGDADRDFVNGMLPHHKGAVEMAKLQLKYGKDPELRRLARAIVAAQDKEIRQMKAWQRKHPAPN